MGSCGWGSVSIMPAVPPPSLRAQRSNPHFDSGIDGLLRCARNDGDMASPSRGMFRPRFASSFAFRKFRGRREDRVLAAPTVSRAICARQNSTRAYRAAGNTPAFPAQWLYGLLRALPGERLFASVACASYRKLSASTATPEPHDFTVRSSCTRQLQLSRPSHLTARS
jgi:hypothetical protein